jgi:hypothetical protein
MGMMQEDGKLLSGPLATRRNGVFEQVVLHVLRQPCPDSRQGVTQRAENLVLDSRRHWVAGHSNLPEQLLLHTEEPHPEGVRLLHLQVINVSTSSPP